MALDPEMLKQLLDVFRIELEEHLSSFDRILVALERTEDDAQRGAHLEEIIRGTHSLKGAARAVGIGEIEKLSHGMEDLVAAHRQHSLDFTEMTEGLYRATDAIREAWRACQPQEKPPRHAPAASPAVTPPGNHAGDQSASASTGDDSPFTHYPSSAANQRAGSDRRGEPEERRVIRRRFDDAVAPRDTVRVDTSKLDALMAQVQELLVMQIRGEQRLQELGELRLTLSELDRDHRELVAAVSRLAKTTKDPEMASLEQVLSNLRERASGAGRAVDSLTHAVSTDGMRTALITADLQEGIRKARMLPVGTLFDTFPRMVRDLSKENNKEVDLVTSGTEIELDKQILEALKDPLTHLLRNAIDHGLQEPDERERAGKPRRGRISLAASQVGNNILVEVSDDGAGIAPDVVLARAVEKDVISPEQADNATDAEAFMLIFRSGFSTSSTVTDISGRGVGLDVVRENVGKLGGVVDVSSEKGKGTSFRMTLPLTVSTFRGLLIEAGGREFAIALSSVVRAMRINHDAIREVGGRQVVIVDDLPIPFVPLCDVLELPAAADVDTEDNALCVVVLGIADRRVAFGVDLVVREEEIIVKNLGPQLARVRNVSAATIMGDGRVVIILNVGDLSRSAQPVASQVVLQTRHIRSRRSGTSRVLVVDDSPTTQTLERNILTTAGYDVHVADSVPKAFEVLERLEIDLIVSDVEMPGESGYELTRRVRSDERISRTPIILISFRDTDADRKRGIDAGADAYIAKSSFNQENLVATVKQLV